MSKQLSREELKEQIELFIMDLTGSVRGSNEKFVTYGEARDHLVQLIEAHTQTASLDELFKGSTVEARFINNISRSATAEGKFADFKIYKAENGWHKVELYWKPETGVDHE